MCEIIIDEMDIIIVYCGGPDIVCCARDPFRACVSFLGN
jgi:hypothetical protein